MNTISFPIRINQTGTAVSDLHAALLFILKRKTDLRLQVGGGSRIAPKEQLTLIFNLRQEAAQNRYGHYTARAVQLLQATQIRPPQSNYSGEIDEKTANSFNEEIRKMNVPEIREKYRVEGLVYDEEGNPISNTRVVALDKNLRDNIQLGANDTNAIGFYEITYTAADFIKLGKNVADIFVQLSGVTPVVKSAVLTNVRTVEEIDLINTTGGTLIFATEYERLSTAVDQTLAAQKINLTDLNTDEDFGFVARLTGYNETRIRQLAEARRLSSNNIPADLLYAALRNGLPANPIQLSTQPKDNLKSVLETAAKTGIIAPRKPADWEKSLIDIQSTAEERAGQDTSDGMPGLRTLLQRAINRPNGAQLSSAFIQRYMRYEGDIKQFWDSLRADGEFTPHAEAIHFTLQSSLIAGMHSPMMDYLAEAKRTGAINQLMDVVRWSEKDWIKTANEKGIPSETPGEKKSDQVRNYVGSVLKAVEAAFPAAFYAQRLIASQTDSSSQETIRAFFQESIWNAAEDQRFNFRTVNVDAYLNDHPDIVPDNQKKHLADQLKQAVRLYRLSSTAEAAVALQKGGIKSSRDITRLGQEKFSKRFGPDLGGNEAAETVYARARQQESLALGIWAINNINLNNPQPRVIQKTNEAGDAQTKSSLGAMGTDSSSSTNWTAIFGPPDTCLHPHCQTVYGPAAYLTDLLEFLNTPKTREGQQNALDFLLARRSDLQKLKLTCDNTNTVLPYIDLVNELLEQEIASPGVPITWQAESAARELAAMPRNVLPEAYEALRLAVHPWNLPFDLERETVDACLGHLGHTRSELLEALFTGSADSRWDDPSIALESLNIAPGEASLIYGTHPAQIWQRWGFPAENLAKDARIPDPLSPDKWIESEDWVSVLTGRVDILLQQSGLGFDDLQNALQCYYINPGRSWEIQAKADHAIDTCKPAEMEISGMDAAGLDRMARFVRLWRRLGWAMAELDKAMSAFNATELDEALVVRLSQVQRLHLQTGLPVVELLAWWDEEMDTQAYTHYEGARQEEMPSLYERIFRNPVVFRPPYPAFTENPDDISGNIDDHLSAVAAVLGVKEPDLRAIEAGGQLSLLNLSELFRKASLAHAMRIGLEEAHTWCRISPANPFDTPAKALEFFDLSQQFIAAGLDAAELKWLLALVPDSPEVQKQVRDKLTALEQVLKALPDEPQPKVLPEESQPQENTQQVAESRKAVIRQFMADNFGIGAEPLRRLMDKLEVMGISAEAFLYEYFFPEPGVAGEPVEQPNKTLVQALFLLLYRTGWGVQRFRLTSGETDYCIESIPDFVDLFQPKIAENDLLRQVGRWKPMLQFLQLRRAVPNWVAIRGAIGTSYKEVLEARLNWNPAYTEALATHFNFNWETVEDWTRGLRSMSLLSRLQISLQEVQKLAYADKNTAQAAWSMLKSRYDEEKWLSVARSINDPLRERRRNALVQYLLANKGVKKNWRDANDIYMYLLIDVEMSACQMTSRLKQAISSVQLFVQRCLFGLEPAIRNLSDQPEWKQWKWMKNYRVWEANRKVFLYPENWIEPELRNDKSPFFKELENDLLQNEITDEHAEGVFRSYLEKLDAVSRLEIVAVYLQEKDNNNKPVNILHVFGRTRGIPHQYYYRRQIDGDYWTAWELVNADIEGNHLIPAFWNGRLYLFWPVFMPRQEEKEVVMPGSGTPLDKGKTFNEVMLAWSEYRNGQWAAKRMSDVKKTAKRDKDGEGNNLIEFFNLNQPLNQLAFQAGEDGFGNLRITLLKPQALQECSNNVRIQYAMQGVENGIPKNPYIDTGVLVYEDTFATQEDICKSNQQDTISIYSFSFSLDVCSGLVNILDVGAVPMNLRRLPGAKPHHQFASYWNGLQMMYPVLDRQAEVLRAQRIFSVAFSHQRGRFTEEIPFFYQDDQRSFLVNTNRPNQVLSSEENQFEPGEMMNIAQQYFPAQEQTLRINTNLSRAPRIIEAPVFRFAPHYHAYTCAFMKKLAQNGLEGLLSKETQGLQAANVFATYAPNEKMVVKPYPIEEVEQHFSGAYSLYNWELFFHAPIMIADRLSKNQRFEEALRWFNFVFNPFSPDPGDASDTSRYWQFRRFSELAKQGISDIEVMLRKLAKDQNNQDVAEFRKSIKAWRNDPFKPHLVARWRNDAYMRFVVMRYIDNLIAWGDNLFQRDTLESINEATQLYVLAAEILGPRPRLIAPRVKPAAKTYEDLKEQLDEFSNALAEIEARLPAEEDVLPLNEEETPLPTLYFSIPSNDKLLGYWDMVADRLFKIRTCRNLSGQVRQLPLFEPPIDPALLVRAAAAGIDIASVTQDLSAGQPIHRFAVLNAKANELIGEVRALGNALLSAFEKRDAEEMALLRSKHERSLLRAMREIRVRQVEEAKENLKSIREEKSSVLYQKEYYQSRDFLNSWESGSLLLGFLAVSLKQLAASGKASSAVLHSVPDGKIGSPTTAGATYGGSNLGKAAGQTSESIETISFLNELLLYITSNMGSYHRRKEEWKFKEDIANIDNRKLDHQILAAQIRLAIAEHELRNHDLQIEQAEEQNEFMQTKFSSQQLYDWMVGKVSGMYFQAYQLALRMAQQAEKAMRYEVGQPLDGKSEFIQSGYWDSLKKGLLAGDLLYQDMKRMETAYLELNTRDLELTKHISLQQLNPLALLYLREKGICDFAIPEELFDLDFPGHYFRRIKSVSITIPCIAGPYTTVNATLQLKNNSIRISTGGEPYPRKQNAEDKRFRDHVMGIQSIATSSAQNDSGLFELNFRDERYLPFEGAGAISEWTLEMMEDKALRQFDYNTIADVIVHLRYTAREGDEQLKTAAINGLKNRLNELKAFSKNTESDTKNPQPGLYRLFSLRYDFPNEWHAWTSKDQPMVIKLDKRHFPYFAQMGSLKVASVQAYPQLGGKTILEPAITTLNLAQQGGTWEWAPGVAFTKEINDGGLKPVEDWWVLLRYEL